MAAKKNGKRKAVVELDTDDPQTGGGCIEVPPAPASGPCLLVWDGERFKWVGPGTEGQVVTVGANGQLHFANPGAGVERGGVVKDPDLP